MPLDLETAKYLADKSKEMIEKQINTHRQKQANAATIIGVNALFIPFFLSGLSDAMMVIKILSIIPILGIGFAIFLLLRTYMLNPLNQGLAIAVYDEAINKPFNEAILFEIGVNRDSYINNNKILDGLNKSYSWAVTLTMSAIGFSIIMLTINMFFKTSPDDSVKIEISNLKPKRTLNTKSSIQNDTLQIEYGKTIIIPIQP
jgi:hypothetical protein